MADLYVTDELHAYLIGQGIGQPPSATPGVVPSLWINPDDGPPTPRDGEDCTITVRDTLLRPADSLAAWLEEAFIDVIVRHRSSEAACRLVHRTIRGLIHPIEAHGGRKMWQMNDLLVEYSTIWRGEQPLPFQQTGDVVTYDRLASYCFGARRKALAGTPDLP